jgi:hypothetical protein
VINATPRPLYSRERYPVPTVSEAGWAPEHVWTGAENLVPTEIGFPDLPARSCSLSRHTFSINTILICHSVLRNWVTAERLPAQSNCVFTRSGHHKVSHHKVSLSLKQSRRGVKLTTHFHVAPRLTGGAYHQWLHYEHSQLFFAFQVCRLVGTFRTAGRTSTSWVHLTHYTQRAPSFVLCIARTGPVSSADRL